MRENDRIIFFYPSTLAVGGTEVLFTRMAAMLAERGRQVAVIDYEDGFIAKNLMHENVELIKYSRSERVAVPTGSCVVSPFSFISKIGNDLSVTDDVRILFWCIHPHNLIWNFHLWNYFKHLRA
jgi:hypothetical protein